MRLCNRACVCLRCARDECGISLRSGEGGEEQSKAGMERELATCLIGEGIDDEVMCVIP